MVDKKQKRKATIFVAVLAIYVLDFAINALQSSCRSLIVDTLSVPKQQIGSAWGKYCYIYGIHGYYMLKT